MNCASQDAHRHPPLRKRFAQLRSAAMLATCLLVTAPAYTPAGMSQTTLPPSEAEIRAAFILNFAKFTEWPPQSFADADTPLTVGFVGTDDARTALVILSTGKVINGRRIVTLQIKSVLVARQCRILFFRKDKGDFADGALEVATEAQALTIGESKNFLARGGLIRLFIEDKRMRFDVNIGAAHRSKIQLSSKLLALARFVVDLPKAAGD